MGAGSATGTLQSALISQLDGTNFSTVNLTVSNITAPQTVIIQGTTTVASSGGSSTSQSQQAVTSNGGGTTIKTSQSATKQSQNPTGTTLDPGLVNGASMASMGPLVCLFFGWFEQTFVQR